MSNDSRVLVQPNRIGVLKSFSLNNSFVDVRSFSDQQANYLPGLGEIEFSGIAPATPQVMELLKRWMTDGIHQPAFVREWSCLYCTSPNPLPETHCSRCGAPRNWLLG
jgi:hypothetical protein